MTVTDILPGQASLPTSGSTRSFWHSEPSKILLGHRTTSSLPTKADIVIVGSGISGASAAYHLRQDANGKSLNVVMLDAREACWGATGRNGGHCQPMLFSSPPEVARFELRNYDAIKSLIDKHDIPCEWKSLPGCHTSMSESMFKQAVEDINQLKIIDPELAKQVTLVTTESTSPSLQDLRVPNAKGAAVQVKAASLWPYKFVAWVLESLISDGYLNLQTNTPVTSLQKVDDDWIIHTPRGMLAAKKVLLTTNGYTSHLLPKFTDLIVAVRGEMSSLIPPSSMRPENPENLPLKYSYGFVGHGTQKIHQDDYLVQRPFATSGQGGELMFGGARSYAAHAGVGVSDDSSIDPPAAAYLRQEIGVMLDLKHDEKELKATYEWSGIMGYSRDGHPWVGEVSEDLGLGGGKGLFVSGGFTGHGMPNTWLSAKAAVNMMMGRQDEVDLPSAYYLTKERLGRARTMDEVAIADARA